MLRVHQVEREREACEKGHDKQTNE